MSLNIKDGKERWHKEICDLDQFYYGSAAPVVVKNHVIAGVSGDDLDIPGYVAVARSGDRRDAVALVRRAAEEGRARSETLAERRRDEARRRHDVAAVTYDPELNLIYVTTGNPQPVIAHKNRAGANLFTGVDRRAQSRHREDGVVLPVVAARHARLGLRRRRRCCSTASSTASRASCSRRRRATASSSCSIAPTGKALVSSDYVKTNWSPGLRREGPADSESGEGPADRRRARLAEPGRRHELAAAELQPADRTVLRQRGARLQRLLHLRSRATTRRAGAAPIAAAGRESMMQAIDYKTGKVNWSHKWEGGARVGPPEHGRQPALRRRRHRTTSSRSMPTTGDALWHARLNSVRQQRADHLRARRHCSTSSSAPATRSGRSPCSTTTQEHSGIQMRSQRLGALLAIAMLGFVSIVGSAQTPAQAPAQAAQRPAGATAMQGPRIRALS